MRNGKGRENKQVNNLIAAEAIIKSLRRQILLLRQITAQNQKSERFADKQKVRIILVWWEKVDSNHRSMTQQIYSLPPLATREFSHIKLELVDGLEPPTC